MRLYHQKTYFFSNYAFYLFLKFYTCINIIFSSSLKPLLCLPDSSQIHDLLKIIIVTYMYTGINTTWWVYLVLFVCTHCRDDQLALDSRLGGSFWWRLMTDPSLSQWLLTFCSSSSRYDTLPECPITMGCQLLSW